MILDLNQATRLFSNMNLIEGNQTRLRNADKALAHALARSMKSRDVDPESLAEVAKALDSLGERLKDIAHDIKSISEGH